MFFKLIKVYLLVSELYIYQNARCKYKNSHTKFHDNPSILNRNIPSEKADVMRIKVAFDNRIAQAS